MKDPYIVLGVSRDATEEQIKAAYRSLARRYHPDRYANDPQGARAAEEKMKEINEAYDTLLHHRAGAGGAGQSSGFAEVRVMINQGRFAEAELALDRMSETVRPAEWHYLKGILLARRGWQNDAMREIETACMMDPSNLEYAQAQDTLRGRFAGFGRSYGGSREGDPRYGNTRGGECSTCDICTGLMCMDCCCESFGGDLIRCI